MSSLTNSQDCHWKSWEIKYVSSSEFQVILRMLVCVSLIAVNARCEQRAAMTHVPALIRQCKHHSHGPANIAHRCHAPLLSQRTFLGASNWRRWLFLRLPLVAVTGEEAGSRWTSLHDVSPRRTCLLFLHRGSTSLYIVFQCQRLIAYRNRERRTPAVPRTWRYAQSCKMISQQIWTKIFKRPGQYFYPEAMIHANMIQQDIPVDFSIAL